MECCGFADVEFAVSVGCVAGGIVKLIAAAVMA